ncbi:MAG: HAMP domain-containing protein [Sphingobacteriia bacterium]|nr:HAMP domain-containing protein [Sphingobacteriia bacterium]
MDKLNKLLNYLLKSKNLSFFIFVIAPLSGLLAYYIIAKNYNKYGPDPKLISTLVILNLILLIITSAIVIKKWLSIKSLKHVKTALKTSSLQRKVVLNFTFIAIIPAIIIALLSVSFINYGVKAWFHERVSVAINESLAVADAYLSEHKETIRTDVLFLANDIDRQLYLYSNNRELLKEHLELHAKVRSLAEIVVFQEKKIVASTKFSTIKSWDDIPKEDIAKAERGEIPPIINSKSRDSVKSIIKLQNFFDSYVLVGRYVDNKILKFIDNVNGAASEYNILMDNLSTLFLEYTIIFILIATLVTLSVIFYGLVFSTSITMPINHLVEVTEKVQLGNLKVRSKVESRDEIGLLANAFNKMISQLEKQHFDLIVANDKLEEKSRFNEKVLSGVSAGVIALDTDKNIKLINPAAKRILKIDEIHQLNTNILTLIPALKDTLEKIEKERIKQTNNIELEYIVENSKIILLLNILVESIEDKIHGFIITFDNITALVSAQRQAAWSEVARRIAHEMKNPLTPIRLSAERLKKKYTNYLEEDEKETFNKCTSTIINNVENITSMVNEFVDFARIPLPQLEKINFYNLIKGVINTVSLENENIAFEVKASKIHDTIGDQKQLSRAFLNLIKNATESVISVKNENPKIIIEIEQDDKNTVISIIDNGSGFDAEVLPKLTEPYMTTKPGGTGLGLAIVKKIIEDHNGMVSFKNLSNNMGAIVSIIIPHNTNLDKENI